MLYERNVEEKVCKTDKWVLSKETKDFLKHKNNLMYLVIGKNKTTETDESTKDYFFCYTARMLDTMCGLQGKNYEERDTSL
jgi:hypothetical protein